MITFASLNILPNYLHIQLVINRIHLRYSSFVELHYEITSQHAKQTIEI